MADEVLIQGQSFIVCLSLHLLASYIELSHKVALQRCRAGKPILIDAVVRAAVGDSMATEALGPVQFRGKAEAVEVFAVRES